MKKEHNSILIFSDTPTITLDKASKISIVIARSALLVLILLTFISVLLSSLILKQINSIGLHSFLPFGVIAIVFTLFYNVKRYGSLLVSAAFVIFLIAIFFLKSELYTGMLAIRTLYLSAYNYFFNTNFLTYSDSLLTTDRDALIMGVIAIIGAFCILISFIWGYLIQKQKSLLPTIIFIALPLSWAAINFAQSPNLLLLAMIFLLVLSTFALESAPCGKIHTIGSARKYCEGAVSSRASSQNLISVIGLASLIAIMVVVIFPKSQYNKPSTFSEITANPINFFEQLWSKSNFKNITFDSLASKISIGGGVSGGKLSQIDRDGFKNETHLEIEIEKETPMLLKGYVGSVYENMEWKNLASSIYEENSEIFSDLKTVGLYPHALTDRFNEISPDDGFGDIEIVKQSIRITNLKANTRYLYAPYGTNKINGYTNQELFLNDTVISGSKTGRNPYVSNSIDFDSDFNSKLFDYFTSEAQKDAVSAYEKFVYENYLQIPQGKYQRLIEDMKALEALNKIPENKILFMQDNIISYLSEHAQYDLSPGRLPNDKDYIEYFLFENHRGYCTNFATAGTMLFRAAGIPARYVEGYTVTDYDMSFNRTGSSSVLIKDSNAHAWVEIYSSGIGWVPVDVTPGFTSEGIANPTAEPDVEKTPSSSVSSSQSTTSSVVSSSTSTNVSSSQAQGDTPDESKPDNQVSGIIMVILTAFAMLSLTALLIFGGKWLASLLRTSRFNQKDKNKAVIFIYFHMTDILSFIGFSKNNNESELDFAQRVTNESVNIKNNDFILLTEAAFRARFSKNGTDGDECKKHLDFVIGFSQELHKSLKPFDKLRYWFI